MTREFDNPERPVSPVTGDKWPPFWATVSAVFPDICPEHTRQSAPQHDWDAAGFIAQTLDQQEAGNFYPTKAPAPARKRKRAGDDDDEEAGIAEQIKNKGNHDAQKRQARRAQGSSYTSSYAKATSYLLQLAFPGIYVKDIETTFRESQSSLHFTYLALRAELSKSEQGRRFKLKKTTSKPAGDPSHVHGIAKAVSNVDAVTKRRAEEEALEEFNAIHGLHLAKEKREADREAIKSAEAERERLNEERAMAEGTMGECQCCFDDYPMNRMVYCTGDTPHYVCYGCAKSFAKSKVGMSQWELNCFADEDCQGTFAHSHRAKFLDDNLTKALDRLEQEHVLQQAGIDLAQCPFCPYAAEYPPVEVNKEFTCENPDCGAVTCRLCRAATHVPKSCDEVKSENAAESARHLIEEDMTRAMIRACNKCKTPYLKENGCNKIICSKCGTIQCYICQQTIKDYSHFRKENTICFDRLHENLDSELMEDVEKAEKAAREKVLKGNAIIQENHLGFKFSTAVQKAEEARRAQALAEAKRRRPPGAPPVIPPELLRGVDQAPARDGGVRQAPQDYQMQLMLLEQQNQRRLAQRRAEDAHAQHAQAQAHFQAQARAQAQARQAMHVQAEVQPQQVPNNQPWQQAAQQQVERAQQQLERARQQAEQARQRNQARRQEHTRQLEQVRQAQQRAQQQWAGGFNVAAQVPVPVVLQPYMAPAAQLAVAPPPFPAPIADPYYQGVPAPAAMPVAGYAVDGLPQLQIGANMGVLPFRVSPPRVVIDLTGDDAAQQMQQPQQAAGLGHIPVDVGPNWGF